MLKKFRYKARPYLRKGDHSMVLIASFASYIKQNRDWDDLKLTSVISEASSKDKNHLYVTLQKYLDEN
ncbi:hypothetical protein [Acinetobacter gerneri]|uniref:hypothetical protein n=1 Tax=Acinetobacter gerneri TaxID=202952 RepID=UPI0023F0585A|nr:hypothetical protein [Acinetobacter gerneri]MCH4245931.1 hypothetical protein [Acinetobacter gerneri]